MTGRKFLACLGIVVCLTSCVGLRGKAKARYVRPDYKAPDIVGMLPADNHSNELRANNTVLKVMAGVLISLGYLPIFSPAQTESLRELGLTDGGQLKAYEPPELIAALGSDSLLYTTIEGFEDINVGLYQNRSVDAVMTLMDAKGNKFWEVEAHSTNRLFQAHFLAGLGSRIAENAILKALNIYMLEETSKAAAKAHKVIPKWPQQ